MKAKTRKLSLLTCIGLGLFTFSGCTDSDYDLSDIDMTVGIGNGEFQLPTCSTDTIQLDDVLELNNSETVIEKENGDYFFIQEGEKVNPTRTSVNPVTITQEKGELYDFNFSVEPYLSQSGKKTTARNINVNLSEEKVIYLFSYNGDCPKEIEELYSADINGNISIKSSFSQSIKAFLPVLDEITLEMPSFITIDNVTSANKYKIDGHKLTIYNVNTKNGLDLHFQLSKIDCRNTTEQLGKVSSSDGKLYIEASLKMILKASSIVADATGVDPTKCRITSSMGIDNKIQITKVSGKFDPVIDLGTFGSSEITGIPDFLDKDGVVLDVDNPQIMLNVESNLDIPGFASGTLTATKDGKTTTVIKIPEMNIIANGTSKICICRNADKVDKNAFTSVIEIPNLSTLLTPIPDHISFTGSARADNSVIADFVLGKMYELTPSYQIEAPLSFAENAKIIYTDSFDDFNDDLEDLDVTENSYIEMTADVVNKVPAYLNASAIAVDINGNEMPQSEIAVNVEGEIAASADGETPEESHLKITLTPTKGALKKLDGLKFTVSGSAKAESEGPTITGQTLNAKKHSLVVKNIKIKFVGKAIADLN